MLRRSSQRYGNDLYGAISSSSDGASFIRELSSIASTVTPLLLKRYRRQAMIVGGITDGFVMASQRINHRYGLDGSDQLQETANLLNVFSHVLLEGEDAADLSLRALNAQLAISYVASGAVKLISPEWRSGRALVGVARTRTYGNQQSAVFLERYPIVGKSICWATIAGETFFPIIYLTPSSLSRPLSFLPHLFHLSIGVFMGLPRFYWTFAAAQPALSYVLETRKGK